MTVALIAVVLVLAIAVLAISRAAGRASDKSGAHAGAGAAAGLGHRLAGSHLPFIAVAQADVEVMRGRTATLPFHIEGARGGGATVKIVISGAGGAAVKTIAVAHVVPSPTSSQVSFVCRLAPGTYVWTVRAVDRLRPRSHDRPLGAPHRRGRLPVAPPTSTGRSTGSSSARA